MQGIRHEPARSLLASFSHDELARLAKRARLDIPLPKSRTALAAAIATHIPIDDIVEHIHRLFPKSRAKPSPSRLDQLPPTHGATTIQTNTKPDTGLILLELDDACRAIRIASAPIFLDNRWPVFACDAGTVPHEMLHAAFIRPGKLHPEAERAPGRGKPFILDEGEFQLRNGRLRMELSRSGPVSFLVVFLRGTGENADYLLEPIA